MRVIRVGVACALGTVGVLLSGCGSGGGKAKPVTPIVRAVPDVLRGTIGSEATIRGAQPQLVCGFGIVVGLNGTGGKPLPDKIRATMEREIQMRSIGPDGSIAPGSKIRLSDPNVAVVVVQAAIPPGAPDGATFDVAVSAVNADSLEGGLLYTTAMRIGAPSLLGSRQTREIGEARGPIFLNPFADPGREDEGVTRTAGRILGGGRVTNALKLELVLDNASHGRAQAMVEAINSRFPASRYGDRDEVARGRDASSIALRVPSWYKDRASEFLELVGHMAIDRRAAEQRARQYVEALKAEPVMAGELSWCLEAIGDKALPYCREMYDYPELNPRLAALRAGARLGDVRAAEPLMKIATTSKGLERLDAIALLSDLGGPKIDFSLRGLLEDSDLATRIAAYEALAKRAEKRQLATLAGRYLRGGAADLSPAYVEELSKVALPPGSIEGVEREMVAGSFFVDYVPVGDPLVYVTQQGRPRIVVFGKDLTLDKPFLASAWSDRMMLICDGDGGPVRALYRDPEGHSIKTTVRGDLRDLIRMFAQHPSVDDQRPGFALSYSEVVGALHELRGSGVGPYRFATEDDRLRGLLVAASNTLAAKDRPETADDAPPEDTVVPVLADRATIDAASEFRPRIVPIPPKSK